jgi:hypothetical protein
VADEHSLAAIERSRAGAPAKFPRRRYRCSCGELGRWTTSAASALAFWRFHAGIDPKVSRRDALRG